MKTITASDRSALIRLASSLPKGNPERRAILAGLKTARLADIPKAARVFEDSMADLKASAKKLKRLFKQHPMINDDWGQGEAAEELVADTLKAIKKLQENPIILGVYATFGMKNHRKEAGLKTARADDIHDSAVAMRKAVRALFVNAEKLERLFKKYPVLEEHKERGDGFPQRSGEEFEKSLDDIIKVMEREVWPRVRSLETYASGFMFRGE